MLDALQQLVIPAWRLVDFQRDPRPLAVTAQVSGAEVGRCVGLAALLPPVPAAEDRVVWHRPVLALDDGDGIAAVDGHDVADPDEVGEVGNHYWDAVTGECLRGIEHEIEVASLRAERRRRAHLARKLKQDVLAERLPGQRVAHQAQQVAMPARIRAAVGLRRAQLVGQDALERGR